MMAEQRLHICWARGRYIGQVRGHGCRRWQTVTGYCLTAEAALSRAALKMAGKKRARVLFIDDSGWYEPSLSMEARAI